MRPSFLVLLLILAGLPSSGPEARARLGTHPQMSTRRVPLDAGDLTQRRVGALTYMGGVRLTSRDAAFGGFSEMSVEGDRFTMISDGGTFIRFRMGPRWRLFDIQFGDLPDGPGTGWDKGDRDSESMTVDPATGTIWVGFENANAIWRYDAALSRAEAHVAPTLMQGWEVNGGPESLVRMRDGSFVVISETTNLKRGVDGRAAMRFSGDPTDPATRFFSFAFRPPEGGYNPSDMTQLPDGRLLVLVRRISINRWFESKLLLIDPAEIRPGATIAGREIATFTMPVTRDNFEALAVTREEGATILWIASDDNLQPVQQSLLMKFRLDLPEAPKPGP